MPKRVMILLAAISLGLAIPACNKNTTPTTTPQPSASFTPNPMISNATVAVTLHGSPAPRIPVQASTPQSSASPRPGTPFITVRTGGSGNAKFKNLKPGQTYCWVALLGNSQVASTCAGWEIWQYQTITIGT
jgi:hypothetical protein